MKLVIAPKNYLCSMTGKLMDDPAMAADKKYYEFSVINTFNKNPNNHVLDKTINCDSDFRTEIKDFLEKNSVCSINDFSSVMTTGMGYKQLVYLDVFLRYSNRSGETALHYLANYNRLDLLTEVLKNINQTIAEEMNKAKKSSSMENPYNAGLDESTKIEILNQCDKWGSTPLHRAASSDSAQIVDLLIENGANPKLQDKKGKTPLHTAAERMSYSALNHMLKYKELLDLEIKNDSGKTALFIAASRGFQENALLLIKNGANVFTKNEHGKTLMDVANENRLEKLKQVLIEKNVLTKAELKAKKAQAKVNAAKENENEGNNNNANPIKESKMEETPKLEIKNKDKERGDEFDVIEMDDMSEEQKIIKRQKKIIKEKEAKINSLVEQINLHTNKLGFFARLIAPLRHKDHAIEMDSFACNNKL